MMNAGVAFVEMFVVVVMMNAGVVVDVGFVSVIAGVVESQEQQPLAYLMTSFSCFSQCSM